MWHPNQRIFDPAKLPYFDVCDPEASGISGIPRYVYHMSRFVYFPTQNTNDDCDEGNNHAAFEPGEAIIDHQNEWSRQRRSER